jgi:hypothetical protein
VNKAFEKIALIEGLVAAAFVSEEGKLCGWCANSVISPDNLSFIAVTCQGILSANRAEQRAYLDSPTNDAVLAWLFQQVDPLLEEAGVSLK